MTRTSIQSVVFYAFHFLAVISLMADDNALAPVKLDNPRDTMKSYYDAMQDYKVGIETGDKGLQKRINDAIRCLNLEDTPFVLRQEKGRVAAIFLKEVIDRIIVLAHEKIPDHTGDKENPLLRWRLKDTEIVVGVIDKGDRAGEYLFTQDTVFRAQEFYEKVKHLPYKPKSGGGAHYQKPWLEQVIPDWARKETFHIGNWQWIGLFLAILFGLIIKKILEFVIHVLKKFTQKTKFEWDNRIVLAVDTPAGLIGASVFWFFAIVILRFEGIPLTVLTVVIQVVLSFSIVWLAYRMVDVVSDYLKTLTLKTDSTLDDQLVPLLRKALKIFVVIFGVLVTFQNLGFNVLSVLAGLGLGGLAFALAAKDTCANFFGSIMILLDRPFNIGDWVIIGNTEGTVEEIGFRSTRIRTFYNSLITIPNAALANDNVDNMGMREYRRIKAFFGLTYDTPAEKMEAFLEGVRNIVEANPNTRKDYYHVVFNSYGDFGLIVMLYCFLKVPDWGHELVERQNIYLEILRLAETIGVEFAFPTRTLHIETFPGQDTARRPHKVDTGKLKEAASGFGPGGAQSKPGGMGIFSPPYEGSNLAKGSTDEGDS
jgi:MscS family membrane protein